MHHICPIKPARVHCQSFHAQDKRKIHFVVRDKLMTVEALGKQLQSKVLRHSSEAFIARIEYQASMLQGRGRRVQPLEILDMINIQNGIFGHNQKCSHTFL